MKKLLLLFVLVLLSGCSTESSEFYIFGPANSCFNSAVIKNCETLKAYDQVKISVNVEKQVVVISQKAYGLNDTNIVFKVLENCKVVDRDNFSCDGLVKAFGRYIDTKFFKSKILTESYLLSLSHFIDFPVKRSVILFFNEFPVATNTAIAIFLVLVLLGINS